MCVFDTHFKSTKVLHLHVRVYICPLCTCVCMYVHTRIIGLTFVIQGALMKAVSEGRWILLDEVNLASAETLQCLSGILETHNDAPLLFMEKA